MGAVREQQSTVVSRRLEGEPRGGKDEAIATLEQLARLARGRLRDRVTGCAGVHEGLPRAATAAGPLRRVDPAAPLGVSPLLLDRRQIGAHALAHLHAEIEACRALSAWSDAAAGVFEKALCEAYVGGLVLALRGGIDLGGGEIVPLCELDLRDEEVGKALGHPAVAPWARDAGSGAAFAQIARTAADDRTFGEVFPRAEGGDGEDARLAWIKRNMQGFVQRHVAPLAAELHRTDGLVPEAVVRRMGELGVFRLSISPEYGGDGLGTVAMTVVIEELARGAAGFGLLAATADLVAEIVFRFGTERQRRTWLPRIAAGDALCAVALSEPAHGSELSRIAARAERQPDGSFVLTGRKAWVAHAARADLILALMRATPWDTADPGAPSGPSLFLVPKRRGDEARPFPDEGLEGEPVRALGQRGMRHWDLRFEGHRIGPEGLLGWREGHGLDQLARALPFGRIHAAACAVGVAQAALEHAMQRAGARLQFGAPLIHFPRIAHRLGRAIARTMAARQLVRAAARAAEGAAAGLGAEDSRTTPCARRPGDVEASAAKLVAVRAACEAADLCVQIHGGNGYAEGSAPARLLLDARGLALRDGTNEMLAQAIAVQLLEGAA